MYKKITLKNNIRILLVPSKDSKSVNLSIYVKAGSRYENEKNNGIAHFLEHMAFKGSEAFKSQFELSKFVEGFGGDWNAGTGNEHIEYYIRAESSHLKDIVYVLDQMLFHPLYLPQEIEKEKGVIIEEINMNNDMPEYKVGILLEKVMWPNHPLGRFICGTKETVSSFSRDDFTSYQDDFYKSSNMVIGLSGKFDEEQALGLLKEAFLKVSDGKLRSYEPLSGVQKEPKLIVESRETEQSHLCFGFRGYPKDDKKRITLKLVSMILGGGISSRLFQKIRTELGLAYYIKASSRSLMDTGAFFIAAGVNNEKFLQAIDATIKEVNKIKSEGVEKEELRRSKEHLKGLLALKFESHHDMNSFLTEQELLSKKVLSYEAYVKEIEKVNLSDISEVVSEVFVSDGLNLAVVGRVKEEEVNSLLSL